MTPRPGRIAAVLVTAVALAGLQLSLAGPARACSCAGGKTPADLRSNQAAALVTRTASTPTDRVDVLHASKKSVRQRVSGPDKSHGCGPGVSIDSIAAVVLIREDDKWSVQTCGYLDQDATFAALLGKPKATATGTPVAWLAGGFGGARAAALNAAGEVTAWAEPGYASQIAACPGGRRVVTAGFPTPEARTAFRDGPAEVVVHDAATLRTIRRVTLPKVRDTYPAELRCADPKGRNIGLLVAVGEGPAELVTITGDRQRRTPVGQLTASTAVRDGFVIAVGEYRKGALLHLRADGTQHKLPSFKGIGISDIVADPSGRRVAVDGYGDEERPVWTVDLRTGKTLGQHDDGKYQASLVWPTAHRILINNGSADPERHPFQIFDARLRSKGTFTPAVGTSYSRLARVEDQLAFYSASARFAVQELKGSGSRVTEEIRLAGAQSFAAAPGRSFDLP